MAGSFGGWRRVRLAVWTAVALASCAWTAPANAAADCQFDAAARTATVRIPPEPFLASTLAAGAGGSIAVDGQPCGAATVTNVDTVVYAALPSTSSDAVDLYVFGPLGPGATDEPGDSDEIEVTFPGATQHVDVGVTYVYSPEPASTTVGTAGINLNAAEGNGVDADIVSPPAGLGTVEVVGTPEADVLDARGGDGAGNARTEGLTTLTGGDGDDVLAGGGAGAVRLFGGSGDNRLIGAPGARWVVASYSDRGFGVNLDLRRTDPQPNPGGDDTLIGVTGLEGTSYSDRLVGDEGSNHIVGGGSSLSGAQSPPDLVEGGGGDDSLVVDAGRADGGDGNDAISGGSGRDEISGGAGNDRIEGWEGVDTLDGGPGADIVSVQGDWRFWPPESDTVRGGPDDDVVYADGGGDVVDGNDGYDNAAVGIGAPAVVANLATDAVRTSDGALYASIPGVEGISGSVAGDILIGDDRENRLFGGAGDDVIVGGAGSDLLNGDAGKDRIAARDGERDDVRCDALDEVIADRLDRAVGCGPVLPPLPPAPTLRKPAIGSLALWASPNRCVRGGTVLVRARPSRVASVRWLRIRTSLGATVIRGDRLAGPIRVRVPSFRRFGVRIDAALTGQAPVGTLVRYRRCAAAPSGR